MKIPGLTRGCSSVLAVSLFLPLPAAKADTDAVTNLVGNIHGYVNGAAGFSFTPTTNLAVTRVGYLNEGNVNPIVRFWAGTNYPMASFPLVTGAVSETMVYSNVSLTLLAGHPYSVTLQEGPTFSNTVVLKAYADFNVGFQVATQLTAYTYVTLNTAGAFSTGGSNGFLLGPNFSYQVQTTPITRPLLKMSRNNASTAVVAWPAPSSGFVLMQAPSLTATNWTLATNAVTVVNTTNQVVVSPLTSNRFYRLFHP